MMFPDFQNKNRLLSELIRLRIFEISEQWKIFTNKTKTKTPTKYIKNTKTPTAAKLILDSRLKLVSRLARCLPEFPNQNLETPAIKFDLDAMLVTEL